MDSEMLSGRMNRLHELRFDLRFAWVRDVLVKRNCSMISVASVYNRRPKPTLETSS